MRQSLALLTAVLFGVAALGCGSGSATPSTPTRTVGATAAGHPNSGYSKADGDGDFDDAAGYNGKPANDDVGLLASYGHTAGRSDMRSIAAVVKRYYTASAAEDGATACSLLTASLVSGVAARTASGNAGGRTCAATMTTLLVKQHKQLLADQVSTMRVTTARVKGTLALAVLGFRTAPESEIVLEREGSAWKIDALFGGDMT